MSELSGGCVETGCGIGWIAPFGRSGGFWLLEEPYWRLKSLFRSDWAIVPVWCFKKQTFSRFYAAMALIMVGMPMIAITRLKL